MNELLFWASAVGSGTGALLKRKAAELLPERRNGPSAYNRAIWHLGSLAHCEFGAVAEDSWRVAPPVLAAGDPAGTVSAVLCGARTVSLLGRLALAAGGSLSVIQQSDAPDIIRVATSTAEDLLRVSRESGIPIQWSAPLAVLSAFSPPIPSEFRETALPSGGWTVQRFSKSNMTWIASSVAEADRKRRGLFRFRSDYDTRHVFRQGPVSREVAPAIAKYWVLGTRQRAMQQDLSRGLVSFPPAARPPGLIDRALVVASGRLPVMTDRGLTYSCITAPVAAAVAAALRSIAVGVES